MSFTVIPVKPISVKIGESIFTQKQEDTLMLPCHVISVCFTPHQRPRLTVIENDSHGMYHDIDFTMAGSRKQNDWHIEFDSYSRIAPTPPPVVTNYLAEIPNKQVCIFNKHRKFVCHGNYHVSFEWDTEIWHLLTTEGYSHVLFHPTHKILWTSHLVNGSCKNDHKILPKWEKQRSYYNT